MYKCTHFPYLGASEAVDGKVDGAVQEGEVAHHNVCQPLRRRRNEPPHTVLVIPSVWFVGSLTD
jgi:hypothetical protein